MLSKIKNVRIINLYKHKFLTAANPATLVPSPTAVFQNLTVLSADPLIIFPSPMASKQLTSSVCPFISFKHWPLTGCHNRNVLSYEPLTIFPPDIIVTVATPYNM